MNSITELLDLEDTDIFVSDILIEGTRKTLILETHLTSHYCPSCGFRMHSRGIKKRSIAHPVLQDGYELFLILKQRRWRCTNPDCNYEINDEFRFVSKGRCSTNARLIPRKKMFFNSCIVSIHEILINGDQDTIFYSSRERKGV